MFDSDTAFYCGEKSFTFDEVEDAITAVVEETGFFSNKKDALLKPCEGEPMVNDVDRLTAFVTCKLEECLPADESALGGFAIGRIRRMVRSRVVS